MTELVLSALVQPPDATIRDAMAAIDRGRAGVCLLVDEAGKLVGMVTDGDLRRALLAGAGMDDAALPYSSRTPHLVESTTSRAHVLDVMKALSVSQVPVVDPDGTLVGLHTMSEVVGTRTLPNPAVIMAGGRGTRLGALTRQRPKPLMTVAGRSILEWIVLNLVSCGVHELYVSVNYLAEQIEEHLGDGSALGCSVTYLREEPDRPLGTAGSLALLRAQRPDLRHSVLVMNGDLMSQFAADDLIAAHERTGAALTVASRPYTHEVPFGVLEVRDGYVHEVAEKPTLQVEANAGVYAVRPDVLDLVPAGVPSTMPELLQECLRRELPVRAWTMDSDWIDVGTPRDLAIAKGLQ